MDATSLNKKETINIRRPSSHQKRVERKNSILEKSGESLKGLL